MSCRGPRVAAQDGSPAMELSSCSSCELSLGCPSGPDRGSWGCEASAILVRTDERAQECPAHAAWSRSDCTQVASGQTPEAVAEGAGVCPRTVRKGVDRYGVKDRRDCRIAHPGRTGCDRLEPTARKRGS